MQFTDIQKISQGTLRILAGACIIIVAGCHQGSEPSQLGVLPPQPARPLWLATMRGEDGTGMPRGAAAITLGESARSSHILLSISGAKPGRALGWYVANGSCTKRSESRLIPSTRYPLLVPMADGSAAAEVTIPDTLDRSKAYAIVVELDKQTSDGGHTDGAACGQLTYGRM